MHGTVRARSRRPLRQHARGAQLYTASQTRRMRDAPGAEHGCMKMPFVATAPSPHPAPPAGPLPPWRAVCAVLGAALLLGACATHEPRRVVQRSAPPLYFYPQQGQSEQRQDRDRYECYQWASRQTRSDPGMTPLRHRVALAPAPEPPHGRDTAVGAATGAVLGGVMASPRHTGEGAAVGLVLGALIGAMSDQARADAAQYRQAATAAAPGPWHDFRRAMSACMAGRGYTVG